MGKFLLSTLLLLTTAFASTAEEKEICISFIAEGTGDGSAFTTSTKVSEIVEIESVQFVTGDITNASNAYYKSKMGVKLGKSKAAGSFGFSLSNVISKAKSITLNAAHYDNVNDANMCINIYINGDTEKLATLTEFKQDELSEKNYIFDSPLEIKSLKFETANTNGSVSSKNQARAFIKSVSITYEDGGEIVEPDNRSENGLAYEQDSYTATFGEDFVSPTIINPNNLPLMYSSSDETVATVDAEGKISLVAAGKTTITASFAGNETYKDGKVSYYLTVNKAPFKPEIPILSENQAYYFIVFKDAESDGTNDIDSNGLKEQILIGSDYYATASNISKVYSGTNGLKFSTSSKNGSITIALSELGKVKAAKIIVNAVNWLGTNGYDAGELSVNGLEAQSLTNELAEYTFTLDGTSLLENIILSATKRIYVKSLTIVYNLEPLALPEIHEDCQSMLTEGAITKEGNLKFADVAEGVDLWYKLEQNQSANALAEVDATHEHGTEGYTKYDPATGIDITKNHVGHTLTVFACDASNGIDSEPVSYAVTVSTGVAEIEAAEAREVRWFDMQGREVKGQPEKGIYVRVANGKASKVVL